MGQLIKTRAEKHQVTHIFSGKTHFFEVLSPSGKKYDVSVQVSCGCPFMSVQGIPNGDICSHVFAVFNKIVKDGEIKPKNG